MSRLLDFYRGEGRDAGGRLLAEVWAWDDAEWEFVHDFIQWLFPLPEPSRFNIHAPDLTAEEIAAFQADDGLRANLRRSYERFLRFLGLVRGEDGQVREGPNFEARVPDVWAWRNHNWLRLTRALRSLRLLGLEPEGRALYHRLEALYRGGRFPITADTFQFWTEAIEGLPFHA